MKIETIIRRIRLKINDEKEYRWGDDQVLAIVNEAIRYIRNVILQQEPTMLVEPPIVGTLADGENAIEVEYTPVRYVDVRANGKPLKIISLSDIRDTDKKGEPEFFYQYGRNEIRFYPAPQRETDYSLLLIKPVEEVTMESELSLEDDFADSVIELAVLRLSMIDEFDMTVETQMLAQIANNVEGKLLNYADTISAVKPYYRR